MSVHAESSSAARPKARKAVHPADVQHATDAGLDLLRVIGRLVLHNVTLPGHSELTIDHVVAGPSGVYVINTIAPTGSVSMAGNILVCAGSSMMEEVGEVADSAAILREMLSGAPVAPILCFQRNAEVAGVVGEVAVCSTENILDLLSGQPDMMAPALQREVMRVLSDSLVQAVRRDQRYEPVAAPKPRHRHKGWSRKRQQSTDEKALVAAIPLAEMPPVPAAVVKLAAEPAPSATPEPVASYAPVLELAPETLDRVAELVADPVVEVVEVPEAVEPQPESVVPARPAARAPAVSSVARSVAPAARPAARHARVLTAVPTVVEPVEPVEIVEPAVEAVEAVVEAPVVVESVETPPAARVWTPASPERTPVSEVEAAPTTSKRRLPRLAVRPALTKAGTVLSRLAPAEPVESVSAAKGRSTPLSVVPAAKAPQPVKPAKAPKPVKAPKAAKVVAVVEAPVAVAPHPSKATPAAAVSTAPQLPAWAKAPAVRLSTATAPPPVEEPAQRRFAGLTKVIVAAIVVGSVVVLSPKVPDAIDWGKGFFVESPTPAAGTLISVPGTTLEPAYDITASAPVPVGPAAGSSVRAGNRLYSVKVRIQSRGSGSLVLPLASRFELVDELGIAYSPATSVKRTDFGATLPKSVKVGPGATLVGTVVFSVPRTRGLDQIAMRMPSTTEQTVAWNVQGD